MVTDSHVNFKLWLSEIIPYPYRLPEFDREKEIGRGEAEKSKGEANAECGVPKMRNGLISDRATHVITDVSSVTYLRRYQ
jgi:hypothetical protein